MVEGLEVSYDGLLPTWVFLVKGLNDVAFGFG